METSIEQNGKSYYRQKIDEIKKYCKENQIYEFCDLIDAIVDGKKIDWLKILRKHYAVREIEQFLG